MICFLSLNLRGGDVYSVVILGYEEGGYWSIRMWVTDDDCIWERGERMRTMVMDDNIVLTALISRDISIF